MLVRCLGKLIYSLSLFIRRLLGEFREGVLVSWSSSYGHRQPERFKSLSGRPAVVCRSFSVNLWAACLNSLVGYFYPSVAAQAGGAQGKGASRHAFTPANRFSAQWQNLASGLRFHCVSVGGERLGRESWRGTSARQDSGLPPVTPSGLCHRVL